MEQARTRISRREFVAAAAGASLALGLEGGPSLLSGQEIQQTAHLRCDVLVCGATPGGIAAAVTAARLGCNVILAEYEDHVGGIVSNGLTNTDLGRDHRSAVGGFFNQFNDRIIEHYRRVDEGDDDILNLKACRKGFAYEPKIAEQIFNEFITEQAPRLRLLMSHQLIQATMASKRVTGAQFETRHHIENRVHVDALVVVDATYEGDFAAMAGAEFRLGREGRSEFDEPHAGRVYMKFGSDDLLPGSTGEPDRAIQSYCFRFTATKDPTNQVPVTKPTGYDKADYKYLLEDIRSGKVKTLSQVFGIYELPQKKVEFNSHEVSPLTGVPSESLDLAEECWPWPEAKPTERRKIYDRYLTHNVGMLWMLQNDPEIPAGLQKDAQQYGWCKDEFIQNNHLPRQVYVREGRRIIGDYFLTERDGDLADGWERAQPQAASIGLVEWDFDSHACHRYDESHPGTREGYTFVRHAIFQIPYGVVVPKVVDGLLVPVACSASHIAYNALRMEPVFMALGEACGQAAHLAVKNKVSVRAVSVEHLQQGLLRNGGAITYFDDLPALSDAFEAFQWLGARGLNKGYSAEADNVLSREEGAERLGKVMESMKRAIPETLAGTADPLSIEDISKWLNAAGFAVDMANVANSVSPPVREGITVSQFAQVLYRAISPAT